MSSLRRPGSRRLAGAAALLVALLATGALAGGVLADDHTREAAPQYEHDEAGNATFEFLDRADHHPGAANVSVRYTLTAGEAFDDVGASDGIAADRFVVETDAVDHADCDTESVAAFGVDRDGDLASGEYDEDLLQQTKRIDYTADGVSVEFYDREDLAGDPPRLAADDRLVLELSDAAAGGGCGETTGEIGFHDAAAFLNGSGPLEANRTDERYGFTIRTGYTYVCACEDEADAREMIGPPIGTPSQTATDVATETDVSTATDATTAAPTATPTRKPRTPTPDGTPVLTVGANASAGNVTLAANASVDEDGVSADVSVGGNGSGERDGGGGAVDPPSPTPADAPGFGTVVAVLALLGGSVLVWRRTS